MAFNDPAIILAAYGTGTRGIDTYRSMDRWFVRRFEEHRIVWAFTSGYLLKSTQPRIRDQVLPLEDTVRKVQESGGRSCVVQSLHVWPAEEYHGIIETLSNARLPLGISVGAPLIMGHSDFDPVLDMLAPDLTFGIREAVVLVAHGTGHSGIALYHAFGNRVRERFGEKVWLELVREPESAVGLRDRAIRLGVKRIRFVPFMMVAGRHVLKDVMGDQAASWRSQLRSAGVESVCEAPALGSRPDVFEKFCTRIEDAVLSLTSEGNPRADGHVILPKGPISANDTSR
ncbi:MAG: sirohydrochlorin cobaltochelatase [Deltaproteobacteria bacterium]|nr:sirohydrochlorin cobaltochelatase [Deltaproteobacteria bacterium]